MVFTGNFSNFGIHSNHVCYSNTFKMRKFIVSLIVAFTVSISVAQRTVNFEHDIYFSQAFDPSIDMDKTYGRFTFKPDYQKIGANLALKSTAFGVYTELESYGSEYNAYVVQRAGRFTGSIQVGYYEFEGRSATTGGFSLLYNHKGGFVGVKVRDLFDVPYNDAGTDEVFYRYEAMSPELLLKQKLFGKGQTNISFIGTASYQDVEKFQGNAILELQAGTWRFGGGRARDLFMGYFAKDVGLVEIFLAVADEVNIGLTINVK